MTEQSRQQHPEKPKRLSDEALGVILLFAAIPLIAYIKWFYDDHVLLGTVASAILAGSAIVLRNKYG